MTSRPTSDLAVDRLSDALAGKALDVVVSGSIGAVESVRFIRALRRLGAEVTPWLTAGGAQFVTGTALAWAAGRPTREGFAGDASHLALGDAAIAAPASASLIGKVANGLTDSAAGALLTSYLGLGAPVLMVPSMHDSLASAPAVRHNLERLASQGVTLLPARLAEGKHKVPDPPTLADCVAHVLNRARTRAQRVLVTMGSTRGYIDDVRYLSNYSSGALGALVAEELYRLGYHTHVVTGASVIRPRVFGTLNETLTNDAMGRGAADAIAGGAAAAVLAASVLDFNPSEKADGKLSSADRETLTVTMRRTPKLIAGINPASGVKVGFKLETKLTAGGAEGLAAKYMREYGLSLMVINDLADVDQARHQAWVFEAGRGVPGGPERIDGKSALALRIAAHVDARLTG